MPVADFMCQPTITDVCKGEERFLLHVAKPYWLALHSCFPQVEPELEQLERNVQGWRDLARSVAGIPMAIEPVADWLLRCTGCEPSHPVPSHT